MTRINVYMLSSCIQCCCPKSTFPTGLVYHCLVLGKAIAWHPNISTRLYNLLYTAEEIDKLKGKVLLPYVNSLWHTTVNPTASFNSSHFVKLTFLLLLKKLDSFHSNINHSFVIIYRCVLDIFVGFPHHFCTLVMNMVYDQHVHYKWHVFLFFVLPRAVRRFCNIISSTFRCSKLVFNRTKQ